MSRMNQSNILLDAIPFPTLIIAIPMFETSFTFQAPEPALSQLPVTHYSITCITGEEEICNETLPANTTSSDLTVVAGVQYTITVSALSNDRESQNNPHCNFGMFSALCFWTHQVKCHVFFLLSTVEFTPQAEKKS